MNKKKDRKYYVEYEFELSDFHRERLAIMYVMDLISSDIHRRTLPDFFNGRINPDWLRQQYNWYNEFILCEGLKQELDDKGQCNYGCFKIRATKKSYIIYSDIARIPKKNLIKKKHWYSKKKLDKELKEKGWK